MSPLKRPLQTVVYALCLASAAPIATLHAQSDTPTAKYAFDVVSIHPSDPAARGMSVRNGGDAYITKNMSLVSLLLEAYDIQMDSLITGLPSWASSQNFDIDAKLDSETAAALKKLDRKQYALQWNHMLQELLVDRFKLQARTVPKEIPAYDLVVAKSGFHIKEADPNNTYANGIKLPFGMKGSGAGATSTSSGHLVGQAISMETLAGMLTGENDRKVVDKTGLTGKYDIDLQWAPADNGTPDPNDTRPALPTALQEQLGLKLVSSRTTVDGLIVTHIERPSEN